MFGGSQLATPWITTTPYSTFLTSFSLIGEDDDTGDARQLGQDNAPTSPGRLEFDFDPNTDDGSALFFSPLPDSLPSALFFIDPAHWPC